MMTETSILVVDDENLLRDAIRLILESAGYKVVTAVNGLDALDVLRTHSVSLIVSDIAMPQMNGYQLFTQVRRNPAWANIPFILLSARDLDSDIRYGKELGIDDYLVKPIHRADLLATVRGKLRRARQWTQSPSTPGLSSTAEADASTFLQVGQIKIDPQQHQVWFQDHEVKLSVREFKLLEQLAQHAGTIVSPEVLIRNTHELETDRVDAGNLLRPLVRSLRRKLGYPTGDMGCIENVRGVGYRLSPP